MRCDAGGVRRSTISLALIAAHPPIVLGCIFDNGDRCFSAQECSALNLFACSASDSLSEPQVALVHNTACYLALKQFQRPEPNRYSFVEGPLS
ncbi:hypothetical protein BKA82DRAFT_1006267 [Pisolithus tinctorius]|uniref:Uncharacterized protein n=1 Tax=Pisolithus tinctorius Marx 270 TaxID=870435 RepID=A0A0C3IJR5_PISTI|nr:hypothetical protein BKA82DRAFT_1006267 [Pisolithus tinctorius]KIN97222.1 hypothetical protein M404DRAFT_1006267 [Pisolithus tinctorius Marx 270]